MMKKFKIKNGYCHINDDRIIITKTPEIGRLFMELCLQYININFADNERQTRFQLRRL